MSCILALGQTKTKTLDVQGGVRAGIPAGNLYMPFLLIITRELVSKSVFERHTSTGSGRITFLITGFAQIFS